MLEAARPANESDLADIEALHGVAMQEIGDSKGGDMYSRREARDAQGKVTLAQSVAREDHLVVVGTIDDSIVGYATAQTEQLPDGALIAEAREIYVLPGARGVGIGEFMLDEMMGWARGLGCERLEGSVLPGNRAGKNFFERAAMVTRILRVSTSLSPQ